MTTTLQDTKSRPFSLAVTDARGNTAQVQNATATSSDESIVAVFLDGNGLTGHVDAVGPLGTATITWTGDADLGDGVENLTASTDVEVIASEATTSVLSFGPEVDPADAATPPPPVDTSGDTTPAVPDPNQPAQPVPDQPDVPTTAPVDDGTAPPPADTEPVNDPTPPETAPDGTPLSPIVPTLPDPGQPDPNAPEGTDPSISNVVDTGSIPGDQAAAQTSDALAQQPDAPVDPNTPEVTDETEAAPEAWPGDAPDEGAGTAATPTL